MALKKKRTESLPDKDGDVFRVGDGVHWGFNGDRDPGTVLYISDSGRKVYVGSDRFEMDKSDGGLKEGDRKGTFTTIEVPAERCIVWSLKKDGYFHYGSIKDKVLCRERCYARNPHI